MNAVVTFDLLVLAPALAPVVGLVLVLLGDAVVPGRGGRWAMPVAVLALVAGAGVAVRGSLVAAEEPLRSLCLPAPDGACLWTAGPRASTLQAGILLAAAAALALLHEGRPRPRDGAVTATLLLAATTGGVAVAAAQDLGSWLVSLELATVPAVALVALRGDRRSAHAGLSLLVTSVASFALLVLGAALWLTATGDASFGPETLALAWADPERRAVAVLAVTVLVAGLGFKLSLVPFHAWTPQAYSSTDLGTVLFLATASKLSARRGAARARRRRGGCGDRDRPRRHAGRRRPRGAGRRLAPPRHRRRPTPAGRQPGCSRGRRSRRPDGSSCPSPP